MLTSQHILTQFALAFFYNNSPRTYTVKSFFSSLVLKFLFLLLSEWFLIFFHIQLFSRRGIFSLSILFSFLIYFLSFSFSFPIYIYSFIDSFLFQVNQNIFFFFHVLQKTILVYNIYTFSSCKIIFLRVNNLFATSNYLFFQIKLFCDVDPFVRDIHFFSYRIQLNVRDV